MQRSSFNRWLLVYPVVLCLTSSLFGQLKSDLPQTTSASQLKSIASPSWLDPQRFSMSHSFSISLMSGTGLPSGTSSLSVYTDQMRYLITNNLLLSSQIHLVQPGIMSSTMPAANNLLLYYQAGMDWWLSDKFNIHLGISNLPPLRRYSPWYRPMYVPFQRYQAPDHSEIMDN
ncbi:MAG: hypothetical protein ACETWG_09535 [Candidatus Neomarinimicrobiota bacterium]